MIGVFDSGYGGLSILKEMLAKLPNYDYLYLGDNARAPYGTRSFETVYHYTLEAVEWLFKQDCPLVILACNTASARALRTIQQIDLPRINPTARVLGVIRPTTETIGYFTASRHIGILATSGTVNSCSYPIEISKFFPDIKVYQQACPLLVPLIENDEYRNEGADFFIKKYVYQLLEQSPQIDTILLACTHYPLLIDKIRAIAGPGIKIIAQGAIVAEQLDDYLKRHSEMEIRLSKNNQRHYFTTDTPQSFNNSANSFLGESIVAQKVQISSH
jgi:glutamate racemase